MNKRVHLLLLCLFGLFFLVTIASTFYFKQLFNESIWQLFLILNEKNITSQSPVFFRLSVEALKAPANLATLIGLPPYFVVWIFCFCLAAYPIIMFLFLRKIYRNTKVIQFLPALVVVFFLAMSPSWVFSVAVTGDCIILSWALFCYILARDHIVWWKLGLLSLPILLSYEAGMIFYILALYILVREKKYSWQNGTILILFFVLQLCNLLFNLIPNNRLNTLNNSYEVLRSPDFWWLIPSIILCACDFFKHSIVRAMFLLFSVFITATITFQTHQIEFGELPYIAHANRIWAIPAAFIILLLLYEIFKKNGGRFRTTTLLIFCILTIPGLIIETKYLFAQKELITRLLHFIDTRPGCHVLNEDEFYSLVGKSNPAHWNFFHLTVLLNFSLKPKTVIFLQQFSKDPADKVPLDNFCKVDSNGLITTQSSKTFYRIRADQNIDFSAVIK